MNVPAFLVSLYAPTLGAMKEGASDRDVFPVEWVASFLEPTLVRFSRDPRTDKIPVRVIAQDPSQVNRNYIDTLGERGWLGEFVEEPMTWPQAIESARAARDEEREPRLAGARPAPGPRVPWATAR